jgi:hypothetical protein
MVSTKTVTSEEFDSIDEVFQHGKQTPQLRIEELEKDIGELEDRVEILTEVIKTLAELL